MCLQRSTCDYEDHRATRKDRKSERHTEVQKVEADSAVHSWKSLVAQWLNCCAAAKSVFMTQGSIPAQG